MLQKKSIPSPRPMFYAASRMKSFQNIYSEHNAVSYRNTQSFKSTLG